MNTSTGIGEGDPRRSASTDPATLWAEHALLLTEMTMTARTTGLLAEIDQGDGPNVSSYGFWTTCI